MPDDFYPAVAHSSASTTRIFCDPSTIPPLASALRASLTSTSSVNILDIGICRPCRGIYDRARAGSTAAAARAAAAAALLGINETGADRDDDVSSAHGEGGGGGGGARASAAAFSKRFSPKLLSELPLRRSNICGAAGYVDLGPALEHLFAGPLPTSA